LKNLERELLEYETEGKSLVDIKKNFGEEDEKMVKVAELKRLEQGRIMKEFFQEFRSNKMK